MHTLHAGRALPCFKNVCCKREVKGSSAALQALLWSIFDAAIWLLQQPGGARLEVSAKCIATTVSNCSCICLFNLFSILAFANAQLATYICCCRIVMTTVFPVCTF